jgi:Fe2+ or Zn2+ uptake regulation protein
MVLEIVRQNEGHLTADEIYLLASEQLSSISRSTVYRNLNILAERGLVVAVNAPERPTFFDRNTEPHHHAVCVSCGMLLDIPADGFDVRSLVPPGYEVVSASLIVNCICARCGEGMSGALDESGGTAADGRAQADASAAADGRA